MSRTGGFILPLTTLNTHAFDFIGIIAQLFYTVSHFVIMLCSLGQSCINKAQKNKTKNYFIVWNKKPLLNLKKKK